MKLMQLNSMALTTVAEAAQFDGRIWLWEPCMLAGMTGRRSNKMKES